MIRRLFPSSLRARTGLLLLGGLCVVQVIGLTVHALDHIDVERRTLLREEQHRAFSIYRSIAEIDASRRKQAVVSLHPPENFTVTLADKPDLTINAREVPLPPHPRRRGPGDGGPGGGPGPGFGAPMGMGFPSDFGMPMFPDEGIPPVLPDRDSQGTAEFHPVMPPQAMPDSMPILHVAMLPLWLMPARLYVGHKPASQSYVISALLPDRSNWLILRFTVPRPNPLESNTFLIAFALMTVCGGALIFWGTQRLMTPLATLVQAAEALGRDVNSGALPETGPTELRRAGLAFNTMAANVRRLLNDRTLMLTAIGHDLRTPITRLKLRSEFIEDDELRAKFLADLDEMEAMVSATLAFGRDNNSREPKVPLDLCALMETIADEAAESQPEKADEITLTLPDKPVRIGARSLALKRALSNLVMNALKYGHAARVTLSEPTQIQRSDPTLFATITIEDNGPGLPQEELERMFEPFVRLETSRNRETGGTGLGLAIARSIIRAHGGEIRLTNRPEGGLRATVTLPA